MNVVRKEDIYTIEDIHALPDGERAELIDGQIYYLAAPTRTHQKLDDNVPSGIYEGFSIGIP